MERNRQNKQCILVIFEQESTTQMMLCDFLKQFSKKKHYDLICKRSLKVQPNDIIRCNIVIAVRSMSPLDTRIIEMCRNAGKKCISFWDDDLSEEREDVFIDKLRRKAMLKELKYVDAVLSPNAYLAHKLSKYGKHPIEIILDTAVDCSDIPRTEKIDNKKLKIVYAAGKTHANDFGKTIVDALKRINDKYPNSFEVTFVGVKPDIDTEMITFPIYHVDSMPMKEYRKYMLDQNFDIGLVPLISNEFTKSKYYNKFVDYTLNNVVGIYSNCLPYTLIIKDGYNGFLVDDTTDSWFNKIENVLTNKAEVEECLENAKNVLLNRFSTDMIVDGFEKNIVGIPSRKRNQSVSPLKLCFFKCSYLLFKYIYLPISYVSKLGIRGTIARISNYVKSIRLVKQV